MIKFGVNRGAENLDPVTQDANPDIWAFMQIYQQLVRVNVKGDGFEPDLAEKWTTSADGRTWTFMLRKDAKFSTGDPVTAADAVWSLKRARDTKGPWKWALEAVEDIAAKDDHTRGHLPQGAVGALPGRHLALLQQHPLGEGVQGRVGRRASPTSRSAPGPSCSPSGRRARC